MQGLFVAAVVSLAIFASPDYEKGDVSWEAAPMVVETPNCFYILAFCDDPNDACQAEYKSECVGTLPIIGTNPQTYMEPTNPPWDHWDGGLNDGCWCVWKTEPVPID